jgi:hypothetical protein
MTEATLESERPLQRLLDQLPRTGTSEDPDEQIRAVLWPIVDRALRLDPTSSQIAPDSATCPNCGGPAASERSPYCSSQCRETAGFVRQFRAAMDSGQAFNLERQIALGQALWSLQGGGYPRRQMMIPRRVIDKVIARDQGVCSVCGGPATEVDHTGSG